MGRKNVCREGGIFLFWFSIFPLSHSNRIFLCIKSYYLFFNENYSHLELALTTLMINLRLVCIENSWGKSFSQHFMVNSSDSFSIKSSFPPYWVSEKIMREETRTFFGWPRIFYVVSAKYPPSPHPLLIYSQSSVIWYVRRLIGFFYCNSLCTVLA